MSEKAPRAPFQSGVTNFAEIKKRLREINPSYPFPKEEEGTKNGVDVTPPPATPATPQDVAWY